MSASEAAVSATVIEAVALLPVLAPTLATAETC